PAARTSSRTCSNTAAEMFSCASKLAGSASSGMILAATKSRTRCRRLSIPAGRLKSTLPPATSESETEIRQLLHSGGVLASPGTDCRPTRQPSANSVTDRGEAEEVESNVEIESRDCISARAAAIRLHVLIPGRNAERGQVLTQQARNRHVRRVIHHQVI